MGEQIAARDGDIITREIQKIVSNLGVGTVGGVAYDTAWTARLAPHYPHEDFDASLEWLRRHQHRDGSWGAPLVQYHDRFISTLIAIIALRENGRELRDERRIKAGEKALWRLVGKLGRDDSDTIGFPLLSAALAEEATALGLDVPLPPARYARKYWGKVRYMLDQPQRDWRASTVAFSLEGLRFAIRDGDQVLEANSSVAVSPSATAAYLMTNSDEGALAYLREVNSWNPDGATPAVGPIDVFEIAWSLIHLKSVGAVSPDDLEVRIALDRLWDAWKPGKGVGYSSHFSVPDVDCTAAAFSVLKWGGYDVDAGVFGNHIKDNRFCTYLDETDPSISVNVRVLAALRLCPDYPLTSDWVSMIISFLTEMDQNGSFWLDKWHASPYYVNSTAILALQGIADDLVESRLKWIIHTQNDDGGWGYLGQSTPEETAYCLLALLQQDRIDARIDPQILDAAEKYLRSHLLDTENTPLWIGKSLYTPHRPVRAVIASALFAYEVQDM